MYQEALENLNLQIQQLNDLMHPEFIKREKNLQTEYTDRLQYNKLQHEYMQERIEHDYVAEKKASVKEFEEKKVELKENLIADFEDKKRHIENERHNMELNGDSMEVLFYNFLKYTFIYKFFLYIKFIYYYLGKTSNDT